MHRYSNKQVQGIWVAFLAFLILFPGITFGCVEALTGNTVFAWFAAAGVWGHLFGMLHTTAFHFFAEHQSLLWWKRGEEPEWVKKCSEAHAEHHKVESKYHGKTDRDSLALRRKARLSSSLRIRVVLRHAVLTSLLFACVLTIPLVLGWFLVAVVMAIVLGFFAGAIAWMFEYEGGHGWTHREDLQKGLLGRVYRTVFHPWIHDIHHKDASRAFSIYTPGAMVELFPDIAFSIFRRLP